MRVVSTTGWCGSSAITCGGGDESDEIGCVKKKKRPNGRDACGEENEGGEGDKKLRTPPRTKTTFRVTTSNGANSRFPGLSGRAMPGANFPFFHEA